MSSAVAELEAGLQGMLLLKPPGVSGSRIASLTALCTANIQSESVLVQKLYTHFKRAPGTHKLGVLYVIDSVTRKWLDQAKANRQAINSSASDGSYAAGVYKVTELLPTLMNDITLTAPVDQQEKIRKLVDIWRAGQTFPDAMLSKFKSQLADQQPKSTTPEGTPPISFEASLNMAQKPTPSADTSSILQALAKMARPNPQNPPSNPITQGLHNDLSMQSTSHLQNAVNASYSQSNVPAVNGTINTPNIFQLHGNDGSGQQRHPPVPQVSAAPPFAGVPNVDPVLQKQLMILETLAKSGVPQEQWPAILSAVMTTAPANNVIPPPPVPFPPTNQNSMSTGWPGTKQEDYRDRSSYQENENRSRRRSRSGSPQRAWNTRDSPNSHRDGYDRYDGGQGSSRSGHGDEQVRGRGNDYRQRSPLGRRGRSPSPPRRGDGGPPVEKFVDYDPSMPEGRVKVLSRTLFVGGVTQRTTEQELKQLFGSFGKVQSVIINREKRHAFVKMTDRRAAEAAKEGMARDGSAGNLTYQVRWGVGFGPRDNCDYAIGVSIIPISKLTDADRKWMLTAEYGGTGGKALKGGMVVEEPDIEIGQGVSSKAISRRMGANGHDGDSPPSRFRQPDKRRDDERDGEREWGAFNANANGHGRVNLNSTGGFSQMTFPSGMPMLPPGISFPVASMLQPPPPPGHN